jgi:flagellar basal body P-ring formation protein FlgA
MLRILILGWFMALAVTPAVAGEVPAVFATRTLRVGALVTAADIEIGRIPEHRAAGVLGRPEEAIGREVRRNLYAGRPIVAEDLGVPTVVERNSLVTVAYRRGGIELTTIGRALDSAGLQELVRVINLDSRTTIVGTVAAPGIVRVGPNGGRS